MTPIEYVKLLEKIQKDHTVLGRKGRKIKYITNSYDTRDNSIYRITFREWFTSEQVSFPRDVEFGKALRISEMYEDIIKWLENKES